jgi:hypothetical protein
VNKASQPGVSFGIVHDRLGEMPMSALNRNLALGRGCARVPWTVLSLLASSAAMTTNGVPAFADELADLRANQELLRARVEQLAQVSDGGARLAAGAAVTGGSFPRSFVIPGTDTSLRVGGDCATQHRLSAVRRRQRHQRAADEHARLWAAARNNASRLWRPGRSRDWRGARRSSPLA